MPHDGIIAILEDDGARIELMLPWLNQLLGEYQVVIFQSASRMIQWLTDHLSNVSLISLDHDLPVITVDGDEGGDGRQVADYLTKFPPTCPVIVHSSNVGAAAGIVRVLKDADWPTWQVSPYGDLEWINEWWGPVVKEIRDKGWITPTPKQ